jgi:hypothetical protein
MLGWLFGRSRDIFIYHDGTGKRRADPLVAMAKIEDACPDLAHLLTLATADAEMRVMPGPVGDAIKGSKREAVAKLLEVTRTAFGVKPLGDKDGLTDAETLALLTSFLKFMGGLAEEARPLPVSPPVESRSQPASPIVCSAGSTTTGT